MFKAVFAATLLVPSLAVAAPGLLPAPGRGVQFVQPGMQIDPVVSEGRVVYRSFESPTVGPRTWIDRLPMSTATRIDMYNTNAPADGRFPEIDGNLISYFLPEGASQNFQGKVAFRWGVLPSNEISAAGGLNVMRGSTAVWNEDGSLTGAKFAWMQMSPSGWDIYWQHGAILVGYPSGISATVNIGAPGVNEVDPTVSNGWVAWATELADINTYVVNLAKADPLPSAPARLTEGRYPQLSIDTMVFEDRSNSYYPSITEVDMNSGGTVTAPLSGLPVADCKGFHRPRISKDGRFVVYRAESCNAAGPAPFLLLTDRTSKCTYLIDSLPRWQPTDDPAFYDVDKESIVYVKQGGSAWNDLDLVYFPIDFNALATSC